MKTPQGFSLIHSLIYVTLLCMITGFLSTFARTMYAYIQKIQTHNSSLMQWYAAYDLLCDDLASLVCSTDIQECTQNKLVYHCMNKTVRWHYKKGKLFRKEIAGGDTKTPNVVVAHFLSHFSFDNRCQKKIIFQLEGCIDGEKYYLPGAHIFME